MYPGRVYKKAMKLEVHVVEAVLSVHVKYLLLLLGVGVGKAVEDFVAEGDDHVG